MKRLDPSDFLADRQAYDAAVAVTPGVSRFCSASAWNVAARRHLVEGDAAAHPETCIWRNDDSGTWLLFGRSPHDYWQPYESAWLFSCPLIGPDPAKTVACFQRAARMNAGGPGGYVVGGLPEGGALQAGLRELAERGARRYQEYPATDCLTINLEKGAEAWLGRRSRKFRLSLRSAERRCAEAGLSLENFDGSGESGLFDRLLAIQPRTAKWTAGTDIFLDERYRSFYRDLFADLQAQGTLRLLFASRDGRDVAFIFGGVFGGEYRGLQMSYDTEAAALGAGNWLQSENIRLRAREGVSIYDLGMEADYKRRWADDRRGLRFAFIVL